MKPLAAYGGRSGVFEEAKRFGIGDIQALNLTRGIDEDSQDNVPVHSAVCDVLRQGNLERRNKLWGDVRALTLVVRRVVEVGVNGKSPSNSVICAEPRYWRD
jgi:hypothetical protein